MVPLLVGNECKAGNEEELCSDSRFLWILHEWSKNNWSRIYNAITKDCLHGTTGSEPVRRAQEREPPPFFPHMHAASSLESKAPCWPTAWLAAVKHLPYGLPLTAPAVSFLQHERPTATSTAVTSKSLLHKRPSAWDGCCALPAQGTLQWFERQKVRYPNPRLPLTRSFVP